MTSEELRLAIVGAGMISENSHLPSALGAGRAIVSAIIDPVEERAYDMARRFDIDVVVAKDIGTALSNFDAAIIATPNSSHANIALECLEGGKAVLIEKPLATSVPEGESIVTRAEETGLHAAVGYSTRFRNNVQLVKELIDNKTFGEARRFVNRFGSVGGWSPVSGYNLTNRASGGGVLVVTGTHFVDRMLYFWGMPESASMLSDSEGGPEANCQCVFEYNDGMRGGAIFSKTVKLPFGTVIDFDEGLVVLGETDGADVVFRPHNEPNYQMIIRHRSSLPFPETASSFENQIDDFVSACLDDRPPRVTAAQGLESLRLIEKLYARSQTIKSQEIHRQQTL